jgi:hypothetical protein
LALPSGVRRKHVYVDAVPAYDAAPCVCLPLHTHTHCMAGLLLLLLRDPRTLTRGERRVRLPAAWAHDVEARWAARTLANPRVYNGTKFRYHPARALVHAPPERQRGRVRE